MSARPSQCSPAERFDRTGTEGPPPSPTGMCPGQRRVIHNERMRVIRRTRFSNGGTHLPSKKQQPSVGGCLVGLFIALLILIGAIAHACSGSSASGGQSLGTGFTGATPSSTYAAPVAEPSPTHTRRHHHHHRRHHHHYSPSPTTAPPAPAGCHPLSDEGTCYEPGEFCRDSDHGVTGVAGDGETITCEDNNGWRWEPT